MNCNSSITEHCLRTSCCDDYELRRIFFQWISQMPQIRLIIFMLNFDIRKRSVAMWTEIIDPRSFVDQSFFIQ